MAVKFLKDGRWIVDAKLLTTEPSIDSFFAVDDERGLPYTTSTNLFLIFPPHPLCPKNLNGVSANLWYLLTPLLLGRHIWKPPERRRKQHIFGTVPNRVPQWNFGGLERIIHNGIKLGGKWKEGLTHYNRPTRKNRE